MKKNTKQKRERQKGFALLMAVIITSTLLLITYALSNISLKELTLSYAGKDSQVAFYAADTGVECAMFWDIKNPRSTEGSAFSTGAESQINCNGNEIVHGSVNTVFTVPVSSNTVIGGDQEGDGVTNSIFQILIDGPGADTGPCAIVSVKKENIVSTQSIKTTIQSRGYNTCNVGNPKRFERALEVVY